jgi:signal transduction histidine kinase
METRIQTLLPEISHGDHCCLLFSSPQAQMEITVPFLALGLERGERSVYVGDPDAIECLRNKMKEAGISVEHEVRKGRLVLSSDREYLESGRFSTDKMLAFLQQTYDATLSEGYSALRAAGDVSWQVGPNRDFNDVVYYETLLDVFFLGKRMVGLCEYPKSACPPEILSGILNTHRIAAIDRDVCSNFHYVPPDLLLEKNDRVRQGKRAEWMTAQLLRARKAEEEVLRLNADLENRVARRTEELAAANQELEAFSYSVSHDLRAPLRAMNGFAQMLLEDEGPKLDDEGRRRLGKVIDGARQMNRLIDALLGLSKQGRTALTPKDQDMTALVRSVAGELRGEFPAGVVEVGPLPPARADGALLRQVLINLIGNALKYSSGRKDSLVRVEGRIRGEEAIYSVKDNGVGFDMAGADKLFGVFQRLHTEQEFAGTGIGLALVKRVIERHGGQVWAEAEVGKGATFYFSLPSTPRSEAPQRRPSDAALPEPE